MKKNIRFLVPVVIILFFLAACTAGPNTTTGIPRMTGEVAGFLKGLWHGFISLFTFIISLFSDKVSLYEVHNNGGWYDFGFMLGIMMFFGSGGRASSMRH